MAARGAGARGAGGAAGGKGGKGGKDAALLEYTLLFLDDERLVAAERLAAAGRARVVFQPYDWGLNDK